ncbi:MAG: TolC family protein [Candidatus Eremiobacteraeota bacterium]|nr:TolC family protein [Candidatus Eremiobacteraeota bacterium]
MRRAARRMVLLAVAAQAAALALGAPPPAHAAPAAVAAATPVPRPSPSASSIPAAAPPKADASLTGSYQAPTLSFGGLTLQQAQAQGITQSPEVAIARARLDAATAALARARAAFGPSIIATYTRNPQAGSTPQPPVIVQHSLNVGVQETLGNISSFVPAIVQAEAAYRSARFDELTAERSERTKVVNLYFAALQARVTAQVRKEALQLAQSQLAAAQKRVNAGDAPRIDVVRAEVSVARATADTETAQAADANATEAVALETAVPPAALQQTSAGEVPAVSPAWLNPATAIQLALTQRADVQSANADVRANAAGLQVARIGILPLLTVSAGYAHGVDVGQPIQGPTLNASFELPLNASAASQVRSAAATLAEAQARLRGVRRAVTLEVGSAVRNLNAAILATAASSKARAAAQEELRATTIGYRSGASSSLERAAAASTYNDARLAELTAIYNEATARAVLLLEINS